MKTLIALSFAILISLTLGLSTNAVVQKKHAPKPAWGTMLLYLGSLQSATASLMVFDMKNVAKRAGEIERRGNYIAGLKQLPEGVRKGHGNLAKAAGKLVAAANSGDEQQVATALAGVIQGCNGCHYNARDAGRRKKMK